MDYCHVCDEPKEDLVKCEGCHQDTCAACCVGITYHNQIDFPFCNICYETGEDGTHTDKETKDLCTILDPKFETIKTN